MIDQIKIKLVDTVLCPADWSWESQKNNWNGYHIWYVIGGGATIKVEEKTYHLSTGDCFLFDLSKNHFCTHNPADPLYVSTVYLNADHLETSMIHRRLIRGDRILGEMICRCVKLHSQNEQLSEMYLKPVLNEFLSEEKKEKTLSPAVSKICATLENNPQKLYALEDMCHMTGYSRNQIIRMFRRDTGMTPMHFQWDHKMQIAASLLLYSNKTIAEIAFEVGMDDANYFSKVFKKYMGKSPQKYRTCIDRNFEAKIEANRPSA
ncbi:MAG: AraC family transcriptional regulator [Fusicatenibacter sp.]|nr:AraC family transcriptional regulator [Fusicatenibacter sp.]